MSDQIDESPHPNGDQESGEVTKSSPDKDLGSEEPDMEKDSLDGDSNDLKYYQPEAQETNYDGEALDKKNPFHGATGYDDAYKHSPHSQSDSFDSLSQSNSSTNENSELTALLPSTESQEAHTGRNKNESKSRLPVKSASGLIRKSSLPKQKITRDIKVSKNMTRSKTVDLAKGVLYHEDRKKLPRGESQTCLNDNHGVRETVTSRMRFEKRHIPHEQECDGDDYMTPTQRRDQLLKDLKVQVKELTSEIEARDQQIERLKQDIDEEARKIIEQKNEEARLLQSNLNSLKTEHDDLKMSYQKSLCSIVDLEETLSQLNERIASQEKRNEQIYLEMYKKGQESSQFERNVELERLAVNAESSSMTMNELIRKLVVTESELAKWQSIRRHESYESAEKPETQADVTLRFLKDSFFHYLTDVKESDHHLRAMIRIFSFTDVQRRKISACVTEKQNKSA
ncbi:DNA repair protein rad-50-like [Mizuhopecten yessoensis]|uniref:GRIP domain-containing protein n=1 Tax=Mizuhopecten yessoensis TaxID=6573 RepID=A0A210PQU1_MIZYE|nr:DNA repair protein rad-50-like [Mizuhopecten yessoensis]XP_021377547.1 DNA repair protein rad-50-like [Mizuhopecten yessoensis]OWF38867.1 hypothetical protein KP79_PYT23665 [Mizuhopecten yessoensis]